MQTDSPNPGPARQTGSAWLPSSSPADAPAPVQASAAVPSVGTGRSAPSPGVSFDSRYVSAVAPQASPVQAPTTITSGAYQPSGDPGVDRLIMLERALKQYGTAFS